MKHIPSCFYNFNPYIVAQTVPKVNPYQQKTNRREKAPADYG
jgi:hypothetical protein